MMNKTIAITCVLAACGGSSKKQPSPDAPPVGDAPPAAVTAVVVAGDFTAGDPGTLATIDVATGAVRTNAAPQGAVGDDPMLRQVGSELFVVNRADGNNVTILDAHTLALVAQMSTGAGSNPQDVAVRGDELFVPVFGGKGVAVLTRGSQTIETIDLSADDPDGKPNCVSAYLAGDKVYVACELLDDTQQYLPPRGPGKVYVIDATSHAVVQTVTMMNVDPLGIFEQLPSGDLVIPTVDFNTMMGCVEKIATAGTPASGGCVVTNTQLTGYGNGLAAQTAGGSSQLLIAASQFDFTHANVQAFDLGSSQLAAAPMTPASELVEAVAACPDGSVVVTDGTMGASGVRSYRGGVEQTAAPIAIGLPTINANAAVCF